MLCKSDGEVREKLRSVIKNKNIRFVGLTCNSHERFKVFETCDFLKKTKPELITVVGGVHVTSCPEEMIKGSKSIDIAVIGDGEEVMEEIIKSSRNDWRKIKGIYYRCKNGDIKFTGKRPTNMDIDKISEIDYSLFDIDDYELILPITGRPPIASIISSRGCPFKCNFCSARKINPIVRYRSLEKFIDEIEFLIKKYPNRKIFIYDDHFLCNKSRVIKFCNLVKERRLKFEWGCYGRIDSIDEELLKHVKDTNCIMISFGLESGSDRMLKKMNKMIKSENSLKALKLCRKYGVKTRVSLVFGYPGETIFDLLKTFKLLAKAKIESNEMVYNYHTVIYPETGLFYQLKDIYLPKNFSWNKKYKIKLCKDVPVYAPRFNILRIGITWTLMRMYGKFIDPILSS